MLERRITLTHPHPVAIQNNFCKFICRWTYVVFMTNMDWFSRKLILAHGIFNYFRSTCFRETNKILIFPWIYFRKYREMIKTKKNKKKNYYYSVFLFFLNMSKYISLLCVFFVTYTVIKNLHSVIPWLSRNSLLKTGAISEN